MAVSYIDGYTGESNTVSGDLTITATVDTSGGGTSRITVAFLYAARANANVNTTVYDYGGTAINMTNIAEFDGPNTETQEAQLSYVLEADMIDATSVAIRFDTSLNCRKTYQAAAFEGVHQTTPQSGWALNESGSATPSDTDHSVSGDNGDAILAVCTAKETFLGLDAPLTTIGSQSIDGPRAGAMGYVLADGSAKTIGCNSDDNRSLGVVIIEQAAAPAAGVKPPSGLALMGVGS